MNRYFDSDEFGSLLKNASSTKPALSFALKRLMVALIKLDEGLAKSLEQMLDVK